MLRQVTALAVLSSFLPLAAGCAVRKTVQQPAGKYASEPSPPGGIVKVRAVLTKTGKKVEFPKPNLVLVVGDGVVDFGRDAELMVVDKKGATLTTRGTDLVSVGVKGRTYEDVRVLSETQDSVTFVTPGSPPVREIPLGEIDQLWVEKQSGHVVGTVVLTAAVVVGLFLLVLVIFPPLG